MKSWSKLKKFAKLGLMMFIMVIALTGCDIPSNTVSDLKSALNQREQDNIRAAEELRASGLISESTYNLIVKNIEDNIGSLADKIDSGDKKAILNMLKSVTDWQIVANCDESNPHIYDEDGKDLGPKYKDDEFKSLYITNYAAGLGDEVSRNLAITTSGASIMPIVAINQNAVDNLNETFALPIYVLNTDFNNKGLDEVIEAIQAGTDKKDSSILDQYFTKLTYTGEDGKEHDVTLLDTSKPENQLVRDSRGQGNNRADEDNKVTNPIVSVWNGATTEPNGNNAHDCNSGVKSFGDTQNRLGYDLVVKSTGNSYDLLSIRLTEFNQDAIDNIKAHYGMSEDRYFICNNRIYVMEYPIGYIAGFKESEDRLSYESIIERSQISVNIRTGNLYKSEIVDGEISKNSVKMSDEDPYYSLFGSTSSLDDAMASFVIDGETGIIPENEDDIDPCNKPWNLRFGEIKLEGEDGPEGVPASVGRIVLRDYLEATYAPGVVGSDSFIVLGRKLRVLNLRGSKKTEVAAFYDKDGNKLEDSALLFVNDFADINLLTGDPQKVGYISGFQEELSSSDSETNTEETVNGESQIQDTEAAEKPTSNETQSQDKTETEEDNANNNDGQSLIKSSISKIDKIEKQILSEIQCTTSFPGKLIDNQEYDLSDDKPLFYAMVVKASMFDTGLFSGWIQSTDQEKNSTVWWNNWLTQHKFTYRINTDSLVVFMKNNYAYELSKTGVIILDLETIAKIQQEFEANHQLETSHGLNTLFVVFGYVLIAYSILMLIAWNIDVNVDFGFNVLEKLTFGRWIAVKDYDEMPFVEMADTNFVKFSEVLKSCIIIMTIGLLLVIVNVVNLVLMFMQLFGGFSIYFTKLITGM